MNDYLLLMHNDVPATSGTDPGAWPRWFGSLREAGAFGGGSAIGDGVCMRRGGEAAPVSATLSGYVRVRAASLAAACALVAGNPAYEAGGTVEVRELPRDDAS